MNHHLIRFLLLGLGTVGCGSGGTADADADEGGLPLSNEVTCAEADSFEPPVIQRLVGPLPGFVPRAIVKDDGGIWFTESQGVTINHLSQEGDLSRLRAPFPTEWVFDAAVGADGNVWFDNVSGDLVASIGRMTPDGETTLHAIPSGDRARHVTQGPDEAVWFTAGQSVGRVTVDGAIEEIPVGARTGDITNGPEDSVWFTEPDANRIGRLTRSGSVSHYDVPTPDSGLGSITLGPDGEVWFTETKSGKLGRITYDGSISEVQVVTSPQRLVELTAGPDGGVWFSLKTGDFHHTRLGHLSSCGVVSFVDLPKVADPIDFDEPTDMPAVPYGIAGGDDEIWVTANLEPFETGVVFRLALGDSEI